MSLLSRQDSAAGNRPRTSPTVKSLVPMNRKNLGNWELRLGLFQTVVLMGVVLGSMACAFYFGFFAGRSVGIDLALNTNSSDAVKFPIPSDQLDDSVAKEPAVSDVYAKLDDKIDLSAASNGEKGNQKNMPELAPIKQADSAPLIGDEPRELESSRHSSGSIEGQPVAKLPPTESQPSAQEPAKSAIVRTLGASEDSKTKAANNSKTLGDSLAEQDGEAAPVVEKEPAHTQPVVKEVVVKEPEKKAAVVPVKVQPVEKTKPVASTKAVENVAPKSAKVEASAALKPGWYAQLAAPKNSDDANAMAKKLKSNGYHVAIENAQVRGENYYRVLVGPEKGRDQADKVVAQLKRSKTVSGDPFIRMVK